MLSLAPGGGRALGYALIKACEQTHNDVAQTLLNAGACTREPGCFEVFGMAVQIIPPPPGPIDIAIQQGNSELGT